MTALVSALIILTDAVGYWAVTAGFIPATVASSLESPPGMVLLPFWLTPISAMLIHGGWLHLALNLVILIYCGRMLERAIGGWSLGLLYLVGAYVGAAGQWALAPDSLRPMIGANGAISAIIAAYALIFAESPVPAIGPIPSRVVRILWLGAAWIGIQFLTGLATDIRQPPAAVGGAVGGFMAGLILARPLLLWRYRNA